MLAGKGGQAGATGRQHRFLDDEHRKAIANLEKQATARAEQMVVLENQRGLPFRIHRTAEDLE